jgi:hypothetical protein
MVEAAATALRADSFWVVVGVFCAVSLLQLERTAKEMISIAILCIKEWFILRVKK